MHGVRLFPIHLTRLGLFGEEGEQAPLFVGEQVGGEGGGGLHGGVRLDQAEGERRGSRLNEDQLLSTAGWSWSIGQLTGRGRRVHGQEKSSLAGM